MMRGSTTAILFAAIFCHNFSFTTSDIIPGWWNLGFGQCSSDFKNCPSCSGVGEFNDCEGDLCSDHGGRDFVRALSLGLGDSFRGCQSLFSDTKWNCTSVQVEHLFGRFVEDCFSRETAMLYAFVSAGITHSVASACQKGLIDGCPCVVHEGPKRANSTTFLYQCNDNMDFGAVITQRFFNCCNDSTKELDLVKKWNIKLGIKIVIEKGLRLFCRCTGLSGSCSIQSCFLKLKPLNEILKMLRMIYEGSQKVKKVTITIKVNYTLRLFSNTDRSPISDYPVHLCDTPNLCRPNATLGIIGTRGRECDPSSSCNSLCCGRGFEPITYNITSQRCWFEWCCRVKCVDNPPIQAKKYICL